MDQIHTILIRMSFDGRASGSVAMIISVLRQIGGRIISKIAPQEGIKMVGLS
jgi:hypothetical protein